MLRICGPLLIAVEQFLNDKMKKEKRYIHDCSNCIFLGRFKKYDLYICLGSQRTGHKFDDTVIARYGEDGDYYSGMPFREVNFALKECFKRACDKGLIKDDYEKAVMRA